jgi:hypothetical protein
MDDRNHRLIVVGCQSKLTEFGKTLQRAIYGVGRPDRYYCVKVVPGSDNAFRFITKSEVPLQKFTTLSAKRRGETFLVKHNCDEQEFRGQLIIRDGVVLERIYRQGFYAPTVWANVTHPVVDLFEAHLEPRTLAQAASSRLEDALKIVKQVTQALEYEEHFNSRYRADDANKRVIRAILGLADMLDSMEKHAAQINFQDALVEERKAKAI